MQFQLVLNILTYLFFFFSVSSLLWAAGRGHYEIVQLLIDNNVKVDIGDKVKIQHKT